VFACRVAFEMRIEVGRCSLCLVFRPQACKRDGSGARGGWRQDGEFLIVVGLMRAVFLRGFGPGRGGAREAVVYYAPGTRLCWIGASLSLSLSLSSTRSLDICFDQKASRFSRSLLVRSVRLVVVFFGTRGSEVILLSLQDGLHVHLAGPLAFAEVGCCRTLDTPLKFPIFALSGHEGSGRGSIVSLRRWCKTRRAGQRHLLVPGRRTSCFVVGVAEGC